MVIWHFGEFKFTEDVLESISLVIITKVGFQNLVSFSIITL